MRFRQAVIEYSVKHGVTKAAVRYHLNRQYIYRWRKRYDGTLESLADRSHRPHSHPNQHTEAEIKLILNMRRRNPNAGIVVFWVKLRQRGYTRSISGLYRFLRKHGAMAVKLPNPKYLPKPYEQMKYPGQRVQIDVKFVPQVCIVGQSEPTQWFQYTFLDEFSRFRYLEAFQEHNTYSSTLFLRHVVQKFPYAIECVQTDNGSEFTNRLLPRGSDKPTLFELELKRMGIRHKLIRPYTPRHNGKVERSHREDQKRFYNTHRFFSLADFGMQLAAHQNRSNDLPMRPLGWLSPKDKLAAFFASLTVQDV